MVSPLSGEHTRYTLPGKLITPGKGALSNRDGALWFCGNARLNRGSDEFPGFCLLWRGIGIILLQIIAKYCKFHISTVLCITVFVKVKQIFLDIHFRKTIINIE